MVVVLIETQTSLNRDTDSSPRMVTAMTGSAQSWSDPARWTG